jgi:predicted RNA-binding protein with EMAP domain
MAEHDRLRQLGFEVVDALAALCRNERDKQVLLRFYRHLFGEFQASFTRPAGLDGLATVEVGTVSTTSKHPKARNLLLCRVDVFGQRLEIVTNLLETRPGRAMKVALVKPAEVMGILSEAQFLGPAAPDATPGARPGLDDAERAELRKSMGVYLDS